MYESLIMLFADIFNKRVSEGKDGFLILKFAVPLQVLCSLYEKLKNYDIPPIEVLPIDEKEDYWFIARQYYETEKEAIMASKAAYMIKLITNY